MKTQCLYTFICALCFCLPVCFAETPDYANDHTGAFDIANDGTLVYGELAASDTDWFKFTSPGLAHIRLTVGSQSGWKRMFVYYADEFGDPIEVTSWWANNASETRTLFIEYPGTIYLMVNDAAGGYYVSAEIVDTTPADNYADVCADANEITVGAAPIEGVLTHGDTLDEDWLYFQTQPLHTYQIDLVQATNSGCYFKTYTENCDLALSSYRSVTVTSWTGEDYKIQVHGSDTSAGEYYTLQVTDIGTYTDDVPNVYSQAASITTDGVEHLGTLEYWSDYHKDEDWYKFTPVGHAKYVITLNNAHPHYKKILVYQEDELGNLEHMIDWWTINEVDSRTVFIEHNRPCYLLVHGDTNIVGTYGVSVEQLEVRPPDSFSNDCATATALAVGTPVTGTLDHSSPFDVDWFEFQTQPMHSYRVQLTDLDNCAVYFRTYNDGCGQVYGDSTDMTVSSWTGESFKLYVHGSDSYFGLYYTLTVTDLGVNGDDYGNTAAEAHSIPKDGTMTAGYMDYYSSVQADEDWFTFIAGQDGDYQILFEEPDSRYKRVWIYSENAVGTLVRKGDFWANGNTYNKTYTLPAGKAYIRVQPDTNVTGNYRVGVVSPEPRCGDLDHPYPAGDTNKDCYVNMEDLANIAETWLDCTSPEPPCDYQPTQG